jgi:hypothetical protein
MVVVLATDSAGGPGGPGDLGAAMRVAERDGDVVVEPVASVESDVSEVGDSGYPGDRNDPKKRHRAPERLTAELAKLLRHNPGLLSGWSAYQEPDEGPLPDPMPQDED